MPRPRQRELSSLDGPRLRAVRAGPADRDLVQGVLEGAPDYHALTENAPAAPGAAERLLADAEADPHRRVYLLVPHAGGPAAGLLDLYLDHPEPGTAHVALLLFRESCQGIGYGGETVAALGHALAEAGYRVLRASVGDENPEAHGFWQHLGFAEAGRLDRGVTVLERGIGPAAGG
jgi:ribosomal protein S18 acetylase RimI-like enzyme